MKIFHLIPNLSGGGAERQLSYLAPELVRMGHEVHVVYVSQGPEKSEMPGVVLHQLKLRSNYDPFLLWQVIRLIHVIKPDIIHTWIMQMDIIGGIAARLTKVPWLLREPSSIMAYSASWKNNLRVRVGSGARAIVCNSLGGMEYWKIRLPHKYSCLVPNGLPLQKIDLISRALPAGLAESQRPIVLYVGRLTSDISASKNLITFLKALASVKQQQDVFGIFCGDGPQRGQLEELRHKLGMDRDVHFTRYLSASSVWAIMKKASVFVSLSAFEGCPNTVMEAMACACPLVLSDISAHREILDENCARFVEPSNVQQIAEAIVQVLKDREASQYRALKAKEKTRKWSISEMAQQYEIIYKQIIK
jgi:glycosyltransferase involved in cell wall biosynthesis